MQLNQKNQESYPNLISSVPNNLQNKLLNTAKTVLSKNSVSVRVQTQDQSTPTPSESTSQQKTSYQQKLNLHDKQTSAYQDNDSQQQKQSFQSSHQKYKRHLAPDKVVPVISPSLFVN